MTTNAALTANPTARTAAPAPVTAPRTPQPPSTLRWQAAPEDVAAAVALHARSVEPGQALDLHIDGSADVYAIHDVLQCHGFDSIRTWFGRDDATGPALALRITATLPAGTRRDPRGADRC